jgi:hypothetical protein
MPTTIKSLTVPARDKAEHDCHCGCSPCDGTCCSLDCIVKPRFFCGQLLTDADLSAMLKWARDRFGLTRYRHGWGVVCGLDVRCDPQSPTSVSVTPGYAVNCCGDDVIVCETATLDLKGACKAEKDPCADLRPERDAVEVVEQEARPVDIYLSYTEQPTDPATALGRSACKQTPECEYSRTRESYKLSWEIGIKDSDPVRSRARIWHEGYQKCIEVLTTFRKKFGQQFSADEVRRWLLRWIDEHPQYQMCGLQETLCHADDNFLTNEKNLVQALFGLVQSCRNAYLQCDCFACDEDTRVPLARVWLFPEDGATGQECRIVAIDPYPPYRRPIQPECWPAPLGYVNVGRFIWHRWEEVCPASADLGLRVKKGDFKLPDTLTELENSLKCDLFIKCGDAREALVYDSGLLGARVVGFCDDGEETEVVTPTLRVTKTASPNPFTIGVDKDVLYTIEVVNTSSETMDIVVEDPKITLREEVNLVPNASRRFEKRVPGPTEAGKHTNGVTVIGSVKGVRKVTERTAADLIARLPNVVEQVCPEITVRGRDSVQPGEKIDFGVEISGGIPVATPVTFNWSLSAGSITSGHGTAVISVDTTGVQGPITATVEVVGYDLSCKDTTKNHTTQVGKPLAHKVGEFFFMGLEERDVQNALETFILRLTEDPSLQGFIFANFGATKDVAEANLQTALKFALSRGVDPARVVAQLADPYTSGTDFTFMELWIVPPGADPPLPRTLPNLVPKVLGTSASDDLTVLNGIASGRLKILNDAGITTFADLAAADPSRLKQLFPMVKDEDRALWIEESKKRAG